MCIAYLALGDPLWPLLIAANRDEYHARPTAAAAPWADRPDIISGLDLKAGGTWLGWTHAGRFALLTNFREPGAQRPDAPSRGMLVSDFLRGHLPAADYAAEVQTAGQRYNGFNLIVGDPQGACYVGNRDPRQQVVSLTPGRYVLSNHLLNTAWPKATRLRTALDAQAPGTLAADPDRVFAVLRDAQPADDRTLPNTGLSPEFERLLSSPFIVSPAYGTRCTTLIAVAADGSTMFSEQQYDPAGQACERHDWHIPVTLLPG